jgi:hypothetical protein
MKQYIATILLTVPMSTALFGNDLVTIDGEEWVLVESRPDTADVFVDALADLITQGLPVDNGLVQSLVEYGKKRSKAYLHTVDFDALARESIELAIDEAVEMRYQGDSGYLAYYIKKPAEKKALRVGIGAVWAKKELMANFVKNAVNAVGTEKSLSDLQNKLVAAYKAAGKGKTLSDMVDTLADHVAAVIVEDRYASPQNNSCLSAWVYKPVEKQVVALLVGKTLKKKLRL